MAEDGFEVQARALTDQNFERQRRDLEKLQAQETRDRDRAWQRQSRSFAENRDRAIADHRAQIAAIDGNEARAMQTLLDRQRSLGGRVVGLVRGRKHHLGQQEALRESFETLRIGKHRQLEQLQGRQDAARLRAQERHAKDGKDMQHRHGQARALAERSLRQAFGRGAGARAETGRAAVPSYWRPVLLLVGAHAGGQGQEASREQAVANGMGLVTLPWRPLPFLGQSGFPVGWAMAGDAGRFDGKER